MRIFKLGAHTNNINVMAETAGWTMPSGDIATMPIEVRRYGERAWAVYLSGDLLCVAAYLKGARAVQALVEQLQDDLRQARALEPAAKPMEAMAFNVD